MQSTAVRSFSVALLWSLACFGCGGTPADPDGGSPGTDAPATVDAGPPGESAHLTFGPDPLPIGAERTVCITVDAGNAVPRQVRGIRTHLPTGSHHMIVYRTSRPLSSTPTPCSPFADGASAVFIAETVNASIEYPADAALEFSANQHVRIEIHEVNYTGEPIDIRAEVDFDFYPLDEVARMPVQFLFTGDMALFLPARTTTEVHSFHFVPDGARIFGLTSHTHGLGVYATIHRATSADDFTDMLHEADDWANPPLDRFDPPLTLEATEGLRLSCEYDNTRDEDVGFGLDFEDEMCFLWAYYY